MGKQTFGKNDYSLNNPALAHRFENTLVFLEKSVPPNSKILDLGIRNLFSEMMEDKGYKVTNTERGIDLDLDYDIVLSEEYDVVTAFEIFEHMVSPFPLLRSIKAKTLVASVPLSLWFARAYWNESDDFDRHYHEFEPRQFDMLLEKAGWKIIKSEKWISKTSGLGIRPFLRNRTPRHYIVHCESI